MPEPSAFEEFYTGTRHRLVTYLYAMTGDRAEAQDAAQEAYVRAWQRWSTVSGYDNPEAWVRTVAYRLCLNHWRKARNRVAAYLRHGSEPDTGPPGENTVVLITALRQLPVNASVLDCPRGTRPEPVDEHWRALRKGRPQDENLVAQHLARYPAGAAARYLDRIRERVSACSPSDERSVRIAAEGFAGDDAVLVVFDHGGGSLTKIVLVREGDLLTEIYSKPVRSDSACRELGRKAAARF